MKTILTGPVWSFALLLLTATSCKKEHTNPGSDNIATGSLVTKFSFEDNFTDEKSGITGTGTNTGFVPGIKGKAYQGGNNAFISFTAAPAGLDAIQSFTTTMWIKTAKHSSGTQCLFTIPNTNSDMGNLVVMIEPNTSTSDSMHMKVYFEKNVSPAIAWYSQWIDFYGDFRLPHMYDTWKQIGFSYDGTTSKFAAFVDGQKLQLDEGMTDRYADDPTSGGAPLGPLSFTNVTRFIIGGYQNHLGSPWTAPGADMTTYTGAMDELRIYNKALTDTEISSLYQAESSGF